MPGTSALIVIDMLNPYEHDDADELAANIAELVEPLSALIAWARESDDQLIYVNDNYGDFAASGEQLAERALRGRHRDLVEPFLPAEGTPLLQKVRHSAFYSTSLEYLLQQRDVTNVILTGQVTEQCILYSALDAYVRHYSVRVPRDAVAPIDPQLGDAALRMMERNMRADITTSAEMMRSHRFVTS